MRMRQSLGIPFFFVNGPSVWNEGPSSSWGRSLVEVRLMLTRYCCSIDVASFCYGSLIDTIASSFNLNEKLLADYDFRP